MTAQTVQGDNGACLWMAWHEAMRAVTGASGTDTLYLSVCFHCMAWGEA